MLIMDDALFNVIHESSLGMSLTGLWVNLEYADAGLCPLNSRDLMVIAMFLLLSAAHVERTEASSA